MPPNTAPHNDRCASLLGQGCDCRSPWDDGDALLNMIVGDLQTGEVYEEPLPRPVTPEEFIDAGVMNGSLPATDVDMRSGGRT